MLIMPSFQKRLIVEQFQGNCLNPCPAGLVSGWVTKNVYPFVKQKHWAENTINANKCELSKVQIWLACFMQKQILILI